MNLPDLIKTGESDTVEFKGKFDERTIETSVAFANTKGGVIFIGVSDKNNVKAIKIGKETLNQWTAYSLKGPYGTIKAPTTSNVAKILGLSERMARNLLKQWVEDGWLEIANSSRRARNYTLSAIYRQQIGSLSAIK